MRNLIYGRMAMLAFLMLLVLPVMVSAADKNVDPDDTVDVVLTNVQVRMQQKVNVDFRETPIEDVLRMLAKQADVDIVKSPAVTGNVTASLSDIPLAEALDNILAAHGYGYVATENMIRIVPRSEILNVQEPLTDRVFHITYADVKELEKALTKFLSTRGSISSMPGTGDIIVKDTESNIKAIDKFIDQVDRVTQQVLVEVRIYDVTDTDAFNLEVAWDIDRNTPITDISRTRTEGSTGSTSNNSGTTSSTTNNAGTTSSTGSTETQTVTVDNMGVYPGNTTDETVTVITDESGTTGSTSNNAGTTGSTTNNRGTSLSDQTTKTTDRTWTQNTNSRSKPFFGGGYDPVNGGVIRIGLLNDAVDLQFVLSMMQKQEWATLLANPSIMVLDNENATFQIVKEIPYKEERQSSAGGSQTSTQFKEVGVKLDVTPKITRDDMLRLQIAPEFGVAEAQRYNTQTGEPIVPTVNTRRLETIALVKNGETVVLGGLRKQEVAKNLYKAPILGDLPIIGALFRSENETMETTELIVFITPRIIEVPVLQGHEAKTYEYTDIPKIDYPTMRLGKKK